MKTFNKANNERSQQVITIAQYEIVMSSNDES
jgi:hypothetical protein